MNDVTARLALPMIVPGQAQKEMSHNEALALLDTAVQASVVAIGTVTPPNDPEPGDCWIAGAAPTGAWAGHGGEIAGWTPGGWRFVAPRPGFRAWVDSARMDARFVDGAWVLGQVTADRLIVAGVQMLGKPAAAIAEPSGGTTVDSAARAALAQILLALQHHNLVETT